MVNTHEQEMALYLEHVATGLRALPSDVREAELEEIEQHLQALTVAHIELGLPQQDATRAALRQFGAASQVARTLVQAWKRGQERRLPGTLAGAVGWSIAGSIAATGIQFLLSYLFPITLGMTTVAIASRIYGAPWALTLATGYITGRMAPRYAMPGSCLAWLMFLVINLTTFFRSTLPHIPVESQPAFLPRYLFMWMCMSVFSLGIRLAGTRLGRKHYRIARHMRLAR
jgi:hypothetical protein